MKRAFSAGVLGLTTILGRCPRLRVNAAPLALNTCIASRDHGLFGKDRSGETQKPTRGTRALPGTNQTGRFSIQVTSNSESRTCMAEAASPSSHSSFCEEVFSTCSRVPLGRVRHGAQHRVYSRMRWIGQIFWLLAYDACGAPHLLPAFTPESFRGLASGKLYPVTAAQLLPSLTGFLAPIHFFKLAKNWERELAACALAVKTI